MGWEGRGYLDRTKQEEQSSLVGGGRARASVGYGAKNFHWLPTGLRWNPLVFSQVLGLSAGFYSDLFMSVMGILKRVLTGGWRSAPLGGSQCQLGDAEIQKA